MKSVDSGVKSHSTCFAFTPSEIAKGLYLYPTWIGHYYCTTDYFMNRDFFPDLLLVYVRKGEFYVDYMGNHYTAEKGDVFFIDCQQPHHYWASNDLEFLYIHMNGSNSHELAHHIIAHHGILYQGDNARAIGKQLYSIVEQCEKDEVIAASDFSLLCYRLLMLLMRKGDPEEGEANPIDESIKYIRENVGKKITLDELADNIGLSKYHFSHLFKKQTGYAPMEYVISTRLDRAKILLKTTSQNVTEIAYEVGYENVGSFINLFVNKEGISPSAFRKTVNTKRT
ncbi:MAG: AraC family transcriptional regulator [Clostridiales Family XIII bacterium]|jgi:AraC-like DNA-binding protein|nr:AraC family transcriptional regulator [Clostridiales Family XIII bacterium]